jgi:hypothetical protein
MIVRASVIILPDEHHLNRRAALILAGQAVEPEERQPGQSLVKHQDGRVMLEQEIGGGVRVHRGDGGGTRHSQRGLVLHQSGRIPCDDDHPG